MSEYNLGVTYIHKDKTTLKQLIALKRKEYKKFPPVQCYMLRELVYFTFDGFEHLHMDGRGKRRSSNDAYNRLLIMDHVPSIILSSRFMKEDKPKIIKGKVAIHYEVYGKVGNNNAKVVVTLRRIGDGNLHFYGIRYKGNKRAGVTPASL